MEDYETKNSFHVLKNSLSDIRVMHDFHIMFTMK